MSLTSQTMDLEKSEDINEAVSDTSTPSRIIVDWAGEDDPKNPLNWPWARKAVALFIISLFTFCSPLSATYVTGVTTQLAIRYNIESDVLLAMLTSSFFIAFAMGPLLLGPLSEVYGRVPVTHFAAAVVVVFNLILPWAPNPATFIVFRLFAGFGASSPLAIGAGVIADIYRSDQRGQAIALYSLCPLLAPTLGPLLGAFVQDYASWHWVFWSISITMALCQCLAFFFFKETYAPVLLERKAKEARRHTTADVRTIFAAKDTNFRDFTKRALVRPFRMLAFEPIVQVLSLVNLVVFGLLFLMLVTIGGTFVRVYEWSDSKAGLTYLALGLGVLVMSQVQGITSDRISAELTRRNDGIRKPEYRLLWLIPSAVLLPVGFLIYGWSAQRRAHWIVPCIGLFVIGAGNIGFLQPTQIYAIECYPLFAASALAAILTLRSFAGFAFPLFGDKLTLTLGLGGGSSMLAGLSVVVCGGSPALLWFCGERLRKASSMSHQ